MFTSKNVTIKPMGLTKIIHVLKNDNFNEVFDLFRNVEAEEVIFIFPKGSKLARQSQHFTAIKHEADSSGKRISIMTIDPVVEQFASQNNIELLKTPETKKREPTVKNISEQFAEFPVEQESDIKLAALTANNPPRIIKDIFRPEYEGEHPIKIKEEKAGSYNIEITKGMATEKTSSDITRVWAQRERIEAPIKKIKSSRVFRKTPFFLAIGAVLVIVLFLYDILGSARIIIRPQKQDLDFQLKVSASSLVTSMDMDFNRIPGQRFNYKDEESGAFETTGQKDVAQKATGEITIFNKSSASQRLVATTRFKSPEGLIFRIPQTITVPAAVRVGAESILMEGSIKSTVYADRPGPEYNIGPSNFTIPGFEGTPKFEDFYAKSEKAMSGGIIGPSKVITESDFTKAQEKITAKLKEKILQALKDQAGELKVLDSTAIKFDLPITNANTGEAAEKLQMTISGAASIMAFRESDILELVKNYVSQKGSLELLEKSLVVKYLNPQNNADGSVMSFDIQAIGKATDKIDVEKILKDVAGMKENAIRDYFKSIKEIESTRVILSPFWVKSIPREPTKIKIQIDKE